MTCPYCRRYFQVKRDTINHMNNEHSKELMDDNMNAEQALYFSTHKKLTGVCMCGCGKDTNWNYKTGKPYKVSTDPKCRERLRKQALINHRKTYGVDTLLNDMEHQKEMLAHRHTSGKYRFSNSNDFIEYASQLELSFLKFCDKVMDFNSNMIQDPPEAFTYIDTKTDTKRQYLPDYYLPDYNLMVEIKDDGNTNPAFLEETKYKVAMKDKIMREQKKYNYIRINGTKYGPFIELLFNIVHDTKTGGTSKTKNNFTVITESACMDMDADMDCSIMGNVGNSIHLMVLYLKEVKIPYAMAITDSTYMERWYMYSELDFTLKEIVTDNEFYTNECCEVFRYVGNKDAIDEVFKIIYNTLESGITEPTWSISTLLRDHGIYFYLNIVCMNNGKKRMDFIKTKSINMEG